MSEYFSEMRWDPYVLARGDGFGKFWQEHTGNAERKILFVIGRGYDPRALDAVRSIRSVGGEGEVWLLAFDNGLEDSPKRSALTEENYQALLELFPIELVKDLDISVDTSTQANTTARNTRIALQSAGELSDFTDVVIDISALPRMVAMTAVSKLLFDLDNLQETTGQTINLHVTTAESLAIDRSAGRGSLSEAVTTVAGFSGSLDSQTQEHHPRVWLPVLGEGQATRLERIKEKIDPDEICPVIPFPSRESRRGDQIIAQHRQILFDDFQIEPRNILHACEYNPFEAYKQLFLAMDRYRVALSEFGGCKAFVSPLSSKLLSIGALLACYDHKRGKVGPTRLEVGMPYIETAVYHDPEIDPNSKVELYSMWIRGEWEI